MTQVPSPTRPHAGTAAGLAVAAAAVAAPVLLLLAARANPDRLNPDAVAYLRVAAYWHDGNVALAVNGYWGPLWSWLVALLLTVLPDPVDAGRAAMAVSAALFLAGGTVLLRALRVAPAVLAIGAWCLLGFAVAWSTKIMTPDLLATGLLALALAGSLAPSWPERRGLQALAGAGYAAAYYAKAVALPLGIALLLAVAIWRLLAGAPPRRTAGAAGLSLAVMLLLAAPYVAVISIDRGGPTIGTSGGINFAMAGPSYVSPSAARFGPRHPAFTTYHRPAEGRVTAWEKPEDMAYRSWTPWQDAAAARQFARLVWFNLTQTAATLARFDALGLGLAALLLAPLAAPGAIRRQPWRAGLVPVALLAGIYLPVISAGEPRYLMLAYPLLLAAAGGLLFGLVAATDGRLPLRRAVAGGILAASFLLPLRHDLQHALRGFPNPHYVAGREIAAALRADPAPGGIASVGELGFSPFFAAYLSDRPFLGTEDTLPDLARLRALGARYLFVAAGGPADATLHDTSTVERTAPPAGGVAAYRLP